MILLANIEANSGMATTAEQLTNGAAALDALVDGVSKVEEDPTVRSVGYGGWPNMLGDMQCDGAVMNGDSLEIGSVGAVSGVLHCAALAREVLRRLPHNMLVGEGARRFATEVGFGEDDMLMPHSQQVWRKKLDTVMTPEQKEGFPDIPLAPLTRIITDPERVRDTTVFMGQDQRGQISVATSTSGWAWKYPGRLGDSPIPGAGYYADSRYGAAACTHTGEMTMRTCAAFTIVDGVRRGESLETSVTRAAHQLLDLKDGFIGEVVLHAIDKENNHFVANLHGTAPIDYWLWQPGMQAPIVQQSTMIGGRA